MKEGLDGELVDVTDVRSRLTRLKALKNHSRANETESVDDDFALHGLDRVNDNGNRTTIQLFERLWAPSESGVQYSEYKDLAYLLSVYVHT